jgi:hypothetical protein
MTRNYDPVALTGGRWVIDTRRRIQVWEPYYYPEPVVVGPAAPEFDPDEIACHCGTTISETCRTRNGHPTRDHSGRRLARRCFCGGEVEARRSLCAECARLSSDARRKVA